MEMKNCYRDITIKEITEQHIGQTLRVAGWVENIRDHGGVSFVDLRDMYGVLQVVIRKTELLKGLTRETCVSIAGPVEKRDEETYNPVRLNWRPVKLQFWERYTDSFPLKS